MLDVFFTVDVEVWCDGWQDIDAKFPSAFQSYIYGRTPQGEFGLPYQLNMLSQHGLRGVFFVEPMFAARFGLEHLREIIDLIQTAGHEVQLHMHTEWVDETQPPLLPGAHGKRQYLRQFTVHEQIELLGQGLDLLKRAGASSPNAFRAGSFGFNADTLTALASQGLSFDASYNATMYGPESGLRPGEVLTDCLTHGSVHEFPMTVYDDGFGRLRHAQLTACSWAEMESLLWQALERGQKSFVLLSHNFEFLDPTLSRVEKVVVKRFEKLCKFLDQNRAQFNTRGFQGLTPEIPLHQPQPLQSTRWKTCVRMVEQLSRRTPAPIIVG